MFISHIAEDKAVALLLKRHLKKAFGGDRFLGFLSSDADSLRGGEQWFAEIVRYLIATKVVLVLLSHASQSRPWINFEAGYGNGCGSKVIPVPINGLTFGEVRYPLAAYHGWTIDRGEELFAAAARYAGVPINGFSPEGFLEELCAIPKASSS